LVEQGYLSRAVNEEDFRSMNLSMTERGHELHRELMAFGRQRQRKLLMALSPAERKSLYSIMNTLRAHLESELEED
jgi:DNA-binding MarR family transcriptional regulator